MPDIAGNSLSAATRLNLTQNLQTFPDTVTATAEDYYAFSVSYLSSVSLSLTGLSNDANLQLLDSAGNPLSIGGIPQVSTNPGRFAEAIDAVLNPGLYYIRVTAGASVTRADYSLNIISDQNLRSDIVWHLYGSDGLGDAGRTRIWQLEPTNLNAPQTVVPAPSQPNPRWWLQAAGDFNQDGQTDLVWRNYDPGDGRVEIWLMNQNGAVRDQIVPIATRPDLNWRIQAAGDFNGDGQPDLVWRNLAGVPTSTNNLEIWLMNGTVRSQTVTIPSTSNPNWRVQAVGDFNQDGNTDLIWRNLDPTNGQLAVWYMNGTVPLSKVVFDTRRDTNWLIQGAGDFNLDGAPDLLWRNYSQTGSERGNVEIWLLNGTFRQQIVPVRGTPDLNWRILSPYTRALSVDPIDTAGNTLARSFNLGTNLSGSATYRGFVGTASFGTVDVSDYYQFTLGSQASLSLSLTELASDLNLELLNSRGEVVQRSTLTGVTAESISRTLDAGAYYIHVFPTQGSSTYALSVGVNNFPVLATQRVLSLNEGSSASITRTLLEVTDIDTPATQLLYTIGTLPAQGGLLANGTTLNAGSTFTQALLDGQGILYSHSGSETLSDSFTFTVSDGAGGTIAATTFSIAVAPVNDPPTLVTNLGLSLSEGGAASITGALLQATDPDSPIEQLVYTIGALPANGRLTFNGTSLSQGSTFSQISLNTGPGLLYSHNGSETLNDSFTFTLADGAGGVLSGNTFAIAIAGVNDPPVLTVPTRTITADQGLNATIAGILISDADVGTQDLTVTLRAGNGVLSLSSLQGVRLIQGDGTEDAILSFSGSLAAVNTAVQSLVYRSNPGFRGPDTIAVTVNDNGNTGAGGDQQVSQTLSLTVIAVNQPPVITLPTLAPVVREDDIAPIAGISISDPDAAGGDLTVELSATNGLLSLSPNSGVTFLTGDGTQDRVLSFRAPLSVVNSALSSLTYRGTPEFSGSDAIVLQVSDNGNTGSGVALSDRKTLTFTVTPVNDRPVVTVPGAQTVNQSGSITLSGITITDVDAGSGSLTANLRAAGGTLSLGAATGITFANGSTNGSNALIFGGTLPALNAALSSLVYTGNPSFRGTDTLTIDVNDNGNTGEGIALSNERTTIAVTVLSVNQPPVISIPTGLTTSAGATLPLAGVVVTDPDAGGTRSTVTIAATSGVLSLTAPTGVEFLVGDGNQNNRITLRGTLGAVNAALATLVYRSNLNFQGLEAITISASDEVATGNGGTSQSDTKTIAVTVGGAVNRVPVVINDAYNTRRNGDLTIASPGVLRNDFDPEGFPLSASLATQALNGTVSLNANGSFTYRPTAGFTGADSFTYLASDGGTTATATVLLSVTNGSPTAVNDTYSTLRNTPLTIAAAGILTNDTDPDRDPLTVTAATLTGSSGGTLSLNSTGAFVYTPVANFAGVDTFTYQATDGQFSSNTATVLITVNPGTNLAPTITTTPALLTYTENGAATPIDSALLITDIDSPTLAGATVAIAGGFSPAQDTLSFATVGPIRGTYNSATGILTFSGPASPIDYQTVLRSVAYANSSNSPSTANRVISFTVNDGSTVNNLGTASRTLSVIAENDAPTAANDVYSTLRNTPLTITTPGVLVNDTDPDGTSLTVSAGNFTGTGGGTLSLNSNGAFVYSPATGFAGIDTFTYVASDGLASASATIQISVGTTNRAPIAVNDTTYSTTRNTPLTVTLPGVLANDTDPDGDTVTVVPGSFTSAGGTLSLNSNGAFTYTPTSTFTGTDTFVYQASDGLLRSSATIQISVAPTTNRAPVAVNDTYSTGVNTPLSVTTPGVLVNDTDPDGNTVTAVAATLRGTGNGTLTLSSTGAFVYTPAVGFTGVDTFTYQASDGLLPSSATIQVTVGSSTNRAPIAVNDTTYTTRQNRPLTIATPGVLVNDTDPDGDTVTAVASTLRGTGGGTVTLSSNGSFIYTPTVGFTGRDTFTYQVSDGRLQSSATIQVGVVTTNTAPVLSNDTTYLTSLNTPLSITTPGVLVNDTDPENDPLTVVPGSVTGNGGGTLSLSSTGAFLYTPTSTFRGTETFAYVASDGLLRSTATIQISVGAANTAPTVTNDTYSTSPNTPLSITAPGVLVNDRDTEQTTLTAIAGTTTSAGGTLNLSSNGAFVYTPIAGFTGTDTFTYRASDGILPSTQFGTVLISVGATTNRAPIAVNDTTYSTGANTSLSITTPGVLANDTDPDGNRVTAIAGTLRGTGGGTLSLNSNGSFLYTPTVGFSGRDTFTYQASDGLLQSTATIQVAVGTTTNRAPVAVNDAFQVTPGALLQIEAADGIGRNDTDPDSDPLSFTIGTSPTRGTLSLSAGGAFSYRPNATFTSGLDSFTYLASDGRLQSNPATVTLTLGTNTAPIANPDSYRVPPNRPFQEIAEDGVLSNDTDTPGSTLTVVSAGIRTSPNGGTLNLSANGAFTYTPRTGIGTDTFTYQASDGSLSSPSTSIVFTVAPNTAPVAASNIYRVLSNTPLTVSNLDGVLSGDTDADGDNLTVSIGVGNRINPNGGTLNLSANGAFTYTPRTAFAGTDTFIYAATDGIGLSNTATITFSVGTNALPTAVVDNYRATTNRPLTVTAPGVLANDLDANGINTLTAFLQNSVQRGTLVLNTDGSFTYRSNPGVTGLDSFTYRANDGFADAIGTVTLSIGPNTAPIAVNDTGYTVNQGSTLTVPLTQRLLANDTDIDGDPLSVVVGTGPIVSSNGGSVTLSTNGTFVYTPRSGFTGNDSFTYAITDGTATSNPATATISVRTNTSAPRVSNDTYTVSANSPFTITAAGVLANDTDPEGDALTVASGVRAGTLGTLSLNSDGSFTYAPNPNQRGVDTFTYQASDRVNTATGTITFSVGATNSPPIVTAPASQSGTINTPVTLSGISVTDIDAGTNTISVGLTAASGNLTLGTTQGLAGSTGNGTATVALTGTLAAINAALTNLRYARTGTLPTGTDTITIIANDRGNFGGTNSPQTGTATIGVTIGQTVQSGQRLRDVLSGPQSSTPANFTAVGNELYFTANDGTSGTELWSSDGTDGGTSRVADLNSIAPAASSNPTGLTAIGNTLYFAATNGVRGPELWSLNLSSPTAVPVQVQSAVPIGGSNPSNLVNLNGTLFFRARNANGSDVLWRSNGTSAGTVEVGTGFTNPGNLTVVGNSLFFRAANGRELWRSDGNTATLVSQLEPTAEISNLTAIGNTLFFTASSSANGRELWQSDGTSTGTRRVSDITVGAGGSNPTSLVNRDGTLFFLAQNGTTLGLYQSTAAGAVSLVRALPSGNTAPSNLTVVGSRLFFVVDASTGPATDRELWQSDGTSAGTTRVTDIFPTGNAAPANLASFNNLLYFTATDATGVKLWRSDGTAPGTTAIGSAFTGVPPANLTPVGTRLYFTADNGGGTEPWVL